MFDLWFMQQITISELDRRMTKGAMQTQAIWYNPNLKRCSFDAFKAWMES